jgi:phosphoribosylformylglycinamidine synthase subunit PurSL
MPTSAPTLTRIEVRTKPGLLDPRAQAAVARARALGLDVPQARSARVYFIEAQTGTPLTREQTDRIITSLLADPVTEIASLGAAMASGSAPSVVEIHPLPGVMDPVAQSVRDAIKDLTGLHVEVSTGTRLDFHGVPLDHAEYIARTALSNSVVHQVTRGPWTPTHLPKGHSYTFTKRTIPLRGLSPDQLTKLSREAHLFLSLAEMQAVQAQYDRLGRDPSDIELETIAQTWSEHCVHKTLKARVRYQESPGQASPSQPSIFSTPRPGHTVHPDGTVTIDNLLKRTVVAATHELIAQGIDWTLSVFKDNSGVVAFDDHWGVNIKVETHNRPSALEPYGGAATGIGGCIRDVIATGLGAKPIASTDVFCVADHRSVTTLPPGVLNPQRILMDVVAGVRDYGNRMGIPTVSGGVHFDDRYVGNPLVFCGCIGLIPRHLISGQSQPGDRIIALGGRTGRDGIHGATFSSAELEQTSSTEFAHAVQIGNAIEEKRLLDAVLRARAGDTHKPGAPLYSAMTDCGAGGFSSAIGEMASQLGAHVHLDKAPLKYAGLSYTEIWISEAQERLVLAVPARNLPALQRICDEEGVELADLGTFGTPTKEIILSYQGHEVGRLSCDFLHDGLPMPTREAAWTNQPTPTTPAPARSLSLESSLLALLAHPTIASKHWIIRQYDHEVQGNTLIKPLVGPRTLGPSDASVIEPVPAAPGRGIALSQGLQTSMGDPALGGDPYQMALAAIDECVRNLVCVGADPARIAILDNFSWPSCDNPRNMGALVRACEGCYDGAKAYRTPFVSGKDSLSNQLRYRDPATGKERLIEVPYTLLITGLGIVPDVARCVTMDAKEPGNALLLVSGATHAASMALANSLYAQCCSAPHAATFPTVDLRTGPAAAHAVFSLIREGLVKSAHDCSEGGLLVAIAEMLIAGSSPAQPIGATLQWAPGAPDDAVLFAEAPSRYVLEVSPQDLPRVAAALARTPGISHTPLGTLTNTGSLTAKLPSGQQTSWSVDALTQAWRTTLDW